jgi:hypothetical protein
MAGLPLSLVRTLARGQDLRVAVETGTYLGDGAVALRSVVDDVISIEVAEDLHRQAVERHGQRAGIDFVRGSSSEVLADVLAAVAKPALFWLDGHWSGGVTGGQEHECPVMDEITTIDRWPHAGASVILIDDARLFLTSPPPPHRPDQWPAFIEIADQLRIAHPRHVTLLDDVIVAGPAAIRPLLDTYAHQNRGGGDGAGPAAVLRALGKVARAVEGRARRYLHRRP